MSASIALVFDQSTVTVVINGVEKSHVIPFSPDAPLEMMDAVRRVAASPSAIVMVVGLAHLEVATPDLPPLGIHERLALLRRDADRYFPLTEPVAVASVNTVAVATPSAALTRWVDAANTVGPVRAIVSAAQLCTHIVPHGTVTIAAGSGETGEVTVHNDVVQSVRRIPSATVPATSADHRPRQTHDASAAHLGQVALTCVRLPLQLQLLDQPLLARMRRTRTRRLATAGALLGVALILLVWSADRWRDQVLVATQTRASELETQVGPAEQALERQRQAVAEVAMVRMATQRATAADAPLQVLASITRVLPKDTFVQRISWDGTQWLVEGTTDNAPRLVPLLDADQRFRDVHVASPGQRFLDAGRQRESFAINFGMQRGGADGTP